MRIRSGQLSLVDCDSEGYPRMVEPHPTYPRMVEPHPTFPQPLIHPPQRLSHPPQRLSHPPQRLSHPSQTGLDEESGEMLHKEIIVLRRGRSLETDVDYLDLDCLVELFNEQLYFQSSEQEYFRFDNDGISYGFDGSDIVALSQNSNHYAITEKCRTCGKAKSRRKFQIPAKYLQKSVSEKDRSPCSKHINVWQEFIYGPPVMMLQTYSLTREELHSITDVSSCLSQFFHKNLVDALLYMFFFGVYFVSCCIFNNVLELAFYVSYGGHLCIHQLASASNINLSFSSSIFQGPAYVFIRVFCKHCIQKENAKVMRHLMKKMKRDILNAAAAS